MSSRPKRIDGPRDGILHLVFGAHVDGEREGLASPAMNLGKEGFAGLRAAVIADGDARAFLGEEAADLAADARVPADNQCRFVGQAIHGVLNPRRATVTAPCMRHR